MRRAARVLGAAALCLAPIAAAPASAEVPPDCVGAITGATYSGPTTRYGHAVLGARSEWRALTVQYRLTPPCRAGETTGQVILPDDMVFEDAEPVLADLDGDGEPEVIAVESHAQKGARLAIYTRRGGTAKRIAATPHIGTRHRWLAQIGAADLDGDGRVEIAYVDRPHLAKVLRIWRLEAGALVEVAAAEGVTNHRFGEPAIRGGIRICAGRPEMILASADWTRLLALTFDGRTVGGTVGGTEIGRDTSPEAFARAMACR